MSDPDFRDELRRLAAEISALAALDEVALVAELARLTNRQSVDGVEARLRAIRGMATRAVIAQCGGAAWGSQRRAALRLGVTERTVSRLALDEPSR